jgi:phosphatidylglycerol---prolipoprotein diacylglyceryl transferase
VAFRIFGLPIRWYGISYIAGFLVGLLILNARVRCDTRYPPNFEGSEFLLYAVGGAIAGGRLGEVLFYNLQYYIAHPFQILFLWEGGMSSHGGMIGVLIATVVFAKKAGMSSLVLIDDVVLATPPGLCFGRIANFFNSELVGKITDVWWAVIFPTFDQLPRHPSQLYQAIAEGPILAVILFAAPRRRLLPGQLASVFLIAYGLLRIVTETFRETDSYLGNWHGFTNGQLLSIGIVLTGASTFFIWGFRERIR